MAITALDVLKTKDEYGKGRRCMITSAVLSGIATNLTGGIFYTGFLVGNDIDIVNVGILSFVSYISSLFCIVTPALLEPFRRRKTLLLALKFAYYFINIIGITLLPVFVHSPEYKTLLFGVIVFVSSFINRIVVTGYSTWHANFLPEDVRADYFSLQHFFANCLSGLVVVFSGLAADLLGKSGHQLEIITVLRYVAFAIAMVDLFVLSRPKEYRYKRYKRSEHRLNVSDIFIMPFKNKAFILVMAIVFAKSFADIISTSSLNYYLVDTVGVKYTFISGINAVYFLFFIVFSRPWKKQISKRGWITTFAIAEGLWAVTQFLYSFVNGSNYIWLMLTVRLSQHVLGVAICVILSNLLYIYLPERDRTNYISFHTLLTSVAALLGTLFGTLLISKLLDTSINLFGSSLSGAQIVVLIESGFHAVAAIVAVIVFLTLRKMGFTKT